MSERKGFNFYESYFDVYRELSAKDKILFMDALLNKQFFGIDPTHLTGMAHFAWTSQKHSINQQVKGWEDKAGHKLHPPSVGESDSPCLQEKEEGKEKVQGEEQQVVYPFSSGGFLKYWEVWKDYKRDQFGFTFKTPTSEQAALKKLVELSGGSEGIAVQIIEQSMANGWKGFFELKTTSDGKSEKRNPQISDAYREGILRDLQAGVDHANDVRNKHDEQSH